MSAVVTQADELLPCPFCGGEAEIVRPPHQHALWGLNCRELNGHMALSMGRTEAEAITAWNQRHRSEAVEELVEVLGRLLSLVDRMDVASWLVTEHPAEWANAGDLVSDARTLISKHRGEQG